MVTRCNYCHEFSCVIQSADLKQISMIIFCSKKQISVIKKKASLCQNKLIRLTLKLSIIIEIYCCAKTFFYMQIKVNPNLINRCVNQMHKIWLILTKYQRTNRSFGSSLGNRKTDNCFIFIHLFIGITLQHS